VLTPGFLRIALKVGFLYSVSREFLEKPIFFKFIRALGSFQIEGQFTLEENLISHFAPRHHCSGTAFIKFLILCNDCLFFFPLFGSRPINGFRRLVNGFKGNVKGKPGLPLGQGSIRIFNVNSDASPDSPLYQKVDFP